MKDQLHRGKFIYVSFIILDILCLIMANTIAILVYPLFGTLKLGFSNYIVIVIYMVIIDVLVTISFNTLGNVWRRSKRNEFLQSIKHVGISMVLLALFLFSTKQGADYSRITVYLAYGIYLAMLLVLRIVWKMILRANRSGGKKPAALLITTIGYAKEGLTVVEKAGLVVKGMFITDKTNEGTVRDIPVIVDPRDATAFICWKWVDVVFICGPEDIDVPESLISSCQQMGVSVFTAPANKQFNYELVKIKTALKRDDKNTGLSFFESERDIPFQIRCMHIVFESEQANQKGFYAYKHSWHLFFCPFGAIDIMVDTGEERKTFSLTDPSAGLILDSHVWREIVWKKSGSVLCVAASGHYDSEILSPDYNSYLEFLQEQKWTETLEFAEFMGESV